MKAGFHHRLKCLNGLGEGMRSPTGGKQWALSRRAAPGSISENQRASAANKILKSLTADKAQTVVSEIFAAALSSDSMPLAMTPLDYPLHPLHPC